MTCIACKMYVVNKNCNCNMEVMDGTTLRLLRMLCAIIKIKIGAETHKDHCMRHGVHKDREQFDYGGHLRPPPDYVQQRGYEGRAEPPRHFEERGRLSMRAGYEQARDEAYRSLGCRPPSPPCRDFGPRGSSPPRAPLSRLGLRSSRGNSGRLVGVMIINGTLVRHHGVVALHLTTMIGTSTAPVEVDQEW
ncbi:hypothetical protein PF008_g13680 [Phytophthora fragariae]|uniref:Uncharacterized protein n=1 Tax=Phytophthora fragariae TaxID=53985 RepID=A0A6G0RK29_9STRA|nr:hypothetical protein PF008_g13680 [Phytophthora fragariae]